MCHITQNGRFTGVNDVTFIAGRWEVNQDMLARLVKHNWVCSQQTSGPEGLVILGLCWGEDGESKEWDFSKSLCCCF